MSLTREEWTELWRAIKLIEHDHCLSELNIGFCAICDKIKFIKDKIQQVIGQME